VLFAPGDRERLLDKLLVSGADVVVVDLEDGVAADDGIKRRAREVVRGWLDRGGRPAGAPAGPPAVLLRVNPLDSPWFAADLSLVASPVLAGIVLPKSEHLADLKEVRHRLGQARAAKDGDGEAAILAGIETARGLHHVESIAESGIVDAVYFGAEDYITDVGGRRTPSSTEVLYARSRVALAARLGDIPAIDQVVVDYRDDDGFVAEVRLARDLGFRGKLCIHPGQVPLANQSFSPSPDEVAMARQIVEAADDAAGAGRGVVSVAGRMVDAPLIERARRLLGEPGAEGMSHL
jgi:citrate lyase subunit beta/citryl-CoA lyase